MFLCKNRHLEVKSILETQGFKVNQEDNYVFKKVLIVN